MKYLIMLPITAWALVAFSQGAFAAKCDAAGFCENFQTYAFYDGALHKGKVVVVGEDSLGFLPEDSAITKTISVRDVAHTNTGDCLPSTPLACVGNESRRTDAGTEVRGKVIGYFSTGHVALDEGGKLISLKVGLVSGFYKPGAIPAAAPAPPAALPKCNSLKICEGDKTYAYKFDDNHILAGVVQSIVNDGLTIFQSDRGSSFQTQYVAVAKAGACHPKFPTACVGLESEKGIIVGYFPTLDYVAVERNGVPSLVAANSLGEVGPRGPKWSYHWVVENGSVIGCMEEGEWPPEISPACEVRAAPDFSCAGTHTSEFVKDIKQCRTKIPTKAAWLKLEGSMQCVAIASYDMDGIAKGAVMQRLKPTDCNHNWYELSEGCEIKYGGQLPFNPLSQFGLDDIIPEIMNLKAGDMVPLDVYKKYDSKKIALTMIYKMYKDYEKDPSEKVAKPNYDYLEGTAVQMAFWEKNLDQIVAKGFLNQHQVHSTSGCLCPEKRANAEDNFLGYHIEPKYLDDHTGVANQVRPKYSTLGLQEGKPEDSPLATAGGSPASVSNYGNIFAVFNSEVKDRTTFTMSDSLGLGEYGNERAMKLRTLNYKSNDNLAKEGSGYIEAQIWGELTIKDVDHFLVNCAGFTPTSAATIEKLKKLGKGVYECKEVSVNGKVVRLEEGKSLD